MSERLTDEQIAPTLYRKYLAGRALTDDAGNEIPSAFNDCRNELRAVLSEVRAARSPGDASASVEEIERLVDEAIYRASRGTDYEPIVAALLYAVRRALAAPAAETTTEKEKTP